MKNIVIKGAREHNLKNIDLTIPRDQLVVVSGVSGSGKSSLVFDTLFAEGQRRYVESLSAYARQFLGRIDKPDIDYIEGLSPAISIEQKTTGRNPRSTVGTITEIYDYLRLLYARIGIAYCPNDGSLIGKQSIDQIINQILELPEDEKLMVLAPVVKGRKGEHEKVFIDAKALGFSRVRVDGTLYPLEEEIKLDKQKKHSIEIVIDRIKLQHENRTRLAEAIETALGLGDGNLLIAFLEGDKEELFFSENGSCPLCGFAMPPLEPRLFSFNSPFGSCPECGGLGFMREFSEALILPNKELSFNEHAFVPFNPTAAWYSAWFEGLASHYNFSLDEPVKNWPAAVFKKVMHGSGKEKIEFTYINKDGNGHFKRFTEWPGVYEELKRRYRESTSDNVLKYYETMMEDCVCSACKGERLKAEALAVKVAGKNINQITSLSIINCLNFFKNLTLTATESQIAAQIFKEIFDRLEFMKSVGLSYLSLNRSSATLSGGEAQRIRLATQIGSSLMGVLYILDEPTIGLHQRDNDRLIATLKHLRDLGNTLVVVEHDAQVIRDADYLVDIGPGAGVHGGEVVAQGTPAEVALIETSPTGRYLSGRETIAVPETRRAGTGAFLKIEKASFHNLKKISVEFPVGVFNVICGVSGSGKSTLLNEIIYPYLNNKINRTHYNVGTVEAIDGAQHFDSLISIDQSAIGRTPRSNPATYVGLWTPVRDLFASLNESKARGYKSGRFSFNVKGGRCEACEGSGVKKIEMHFLPDVFVVCDVCNGKRFNKETLDIHYKGKNIDDVLNMTIEEAATFFEAIPSVKRKLDTLCEVGLGYITLGQNALTLSGGEAQRVKLALELSKRNTGKTCYIIDEPTTGLHFLDVKKLLVSLQSLVDKGNTIMLIEHNLDVIKCADFVVDLGPEGGDEGGKIMATGTPEAISNNKNSVTGSYLKELLS